MANNKTTKPGEQPLPDSWVTTAANGFEWLPCGPDYPCPHCQGTLRASCSVGSNGTVLCRNPNVDHGQAEKRTDKRDYHYWLHKEYRRKSTR